MAAVLPGFAAINSVHRDIAATAGSPAEKGKMRKLFAL